MRNLGFPREILKWNRDSPVSDVSLYWWPQCDWSLWPRLGRALSPTVTRPSCRQCDNPIWFHTALLSQFHARRRSSFRLHNRHSRLLGGGALWRACTLTAFILSSTVPVIHPYCFPSWGTRVQSPGYLCETGIHRLALSRYNSPVLRYWCGLSFNLWGHSLWILSYCY